MYRCIAFVFFAFSFLKFFAQDDYNVQAKQFYIFGANAYFGMGDNSAPNSDLGQYFGADLYYKNYLLGAMRVYHGEFLPFKSPVNHSEVISIYAGLAKKNKYSSLSMCLGTGYFEKVERGAFLYSTGYMGGHYQKITSTSPCLDLIANAMLHVRGIGIGFKIHANLNTVESYAAYCFFIQAGWWWNKKKG